MGKIRDHLGYGSFMVIAILIGIICIMAFNATETLATFTGIGITIILFYLINRLADKKETEKIHARQAAFNNEFENFKTRYAMDFENMPYLYPLIDMARTNTIKLCEEHPGDYINVKDYRNATNRIIVLKLNEHLSAYRHRRDLHEEEIKKFINEIKRRENL